MEIACCGLDCRECAVYLASVNGDTKRQEELAKEYSTESHRFSKEDMFCQGCHSDTVSEKMCGDCEIRKCSREKSWRNCGECDSYPCSVLVQYSGDDSDNLKNLRRIAAGHRKEE